MISPRIVGKNIGIALLSLLLLFTGLQDAAASASDPLDQVKGSVDAILSIVRENQPAGEGEKLPEAFRQQIIDLVYDRFDFRAMSRLALARNWKTISTQEQDHFVFLFAKLLENTYYDRINSYSGEDVVFKEQRIKKNKAVVSSLVVRNSVETPVVYKLRIIKDKWLVYDVVIEGVSLVRNYRTQFASIVEKEKYAGLVKRLEEKIAKKEAAE